MKRPWGQACNPSQVMRPTLPNEAVGENVEYEADGSDLLLVTFCHHRKLRNVTLRELALVSFGFGKDVIWFWAKITV